MNAAAEPAVEYEIADGIARLHLNRPHRLNAVVPELVDRLGDALRQAGEDGAAVVVLAGRGRAFCSGHDLRANDSSVDERESRRRLEAIQDVTRRMRSAEYVTVAAVHGYALGAGCEFALGADLIIAAEDAQFGFPEVSVGLSVTGGISRLLPLAIGAAKAKELVLLGERFTATDAAALGLINRVVEAGRHEEAALQLAARLVEQPRQALRLAKAAFDQGPEGSLESALQTEIIHALLTEHSAEAAEGRAGFRRRRASDA